MKNKKGFTIVELITVLLILALLSSIAIVSVTRIRHQANTKEIESLKSSIIDAFNNYRIENGVSKNTTTSIDKLQFDKTLTYNNNQCTLDENDTIKYIVKGDYLGYFENDVNDDNRLKYGVCMTNPTTEKDENGNTKIKNQCDRYKDNIIIPSKTEGFCIKLVCNGVTVIDDYSDTSSLCSK